MNLLCPSIMYNFVTTFFHMKIFLFSVDIFQGRGWNGGKNTHFCDYNLNFVLLM